MLVVSCKGAGVVPFYFQWRSCTYAFLIYVFLLFAFVTCTDDLAFNYLEPSQNVITMTHYILLNMERRWQFQSLILLSNISLIEKVFLGK